MTQALNVSLPRILVVDDSRIVRAGVKKHLAGSFDIVEEADGEAGWRRLMADPTIVVLMSDLAMPILDGFGLLQRVRRASDVRIRQLPVIILSGDEEMSVKHQAADMGASDFVTKSTDRVEMLARVVAAVKLAHTARTLRHTEAVAANSAVIDPTTGAGSGHLFHLEGEKALARTQRYQGEATLVLFELDGFTAMCETLGQTICDQLLGLVARLVSERLRREETLSRLDGARFGVVLYADVEGSLIYARRLRDIVAAARVNFKGRTLQVTASIGLANARADAVAGFTDLLAAAVERLMAAQAAGGNQWKAPAAMPSLTLEQALTLIAEGKPERVMPHLSQLLALIKPLTDLNR